MKGWGSPSSLSRENTAKTFPEHSANPFSHCGKSHKEKFGTKDQTAQFAHLSFKVTRKHRPNSSSFNHKSRKSHQGMDGHALGLGHISCCHVFPSAEIKNHKTQHYTNVPLPCDPPTSKASAEQSPAGRALVAPSIAAAGRIFAKISKQPSLNVKSVLWKGNTTHHFHLRKAAGLWLDFHDISNNNKNKLLCKTKEQSGAALSCTETSCPVPDHRSGLFSCCPAPPAVACTSAQPQNCSGKTQDDTTLCQQRTGGSGTISSFCPPGSGRGDPKGQNPQGGQDPAQTPAQPRDPPVPALRCPACCSQHILCPFTPNKPPSLSLPSLHAPHSLFHS